MLLVTDHLVIKGNLRQVYHCFWNPELWPQITPHVKRIEMLESDSTFQRFKMHVEANGKLHAMETERQAIINEKITYRQTQPPPFFHEHTGEWNFTEVREGVQVTLVHRVGINEAKAKEVLGVASLAEAENVISMTLKRNGFLTMSAIKKLVEERATAAEAKTEV